MGTAVETAFFKHVFSHYYQVSVGFSYWRGRQDCEVDIVAEVGGELVPFEVKYTESAVRMEDLKGLRALCGEKRISRAYVVTRDMADFEVIATPGGAKSDDGAEGGTNILKIPAPLACYWLSQMELRKVGEPKDRAE